jgi:hypothetical protein
VDDPKAARPLAGVVELLGPLADCYAAVALTSGRPAVLAAHQDLRDSVAVRDSGGHLEDKRYAVTQVLTWLSIALIWCMRARTPAALACCLLLTRTTLAMNPPSKARTQRASWPQLPLAAMRPMNRSMSTTKRMWVPSPTRSCSSSARPGTPGAARQLR